VNDSQGRPAPTLAGNNLARKLVRIPGDLPPGPSVLMFAFSPMHQSEAMSWAQTLRSLVESGRAGALQVIVLPSIAKLGEGMLIEQLKKTVPAEAHEGTVLAFTDPGAVAKAAGAPDAGKVALVLIDGARTIAWSAVGPHTSELESGLLAAL